MAHRASPLYDLEPRDPRTSWKVVVRRFFVCLSQMACVMLLAYSITEPEPRDLNDPWTIKSLWIVEPIKTLDELCTPRTFFQSPRCQCLPSLKQISLHIVIVDPSNSMHVSEEVDPSDSMHFSEDAADAKVDSTLDHLW
jgi:hypothetical protein